MEIKEWMKSTIDKSDIDSVVELDCGCIIRCMKDNHIDMILSKICYSCKSNGLERLCKYQNSCHANGIEKSC